MDLRADHRGAVAAGRDHREFQSGYNIFNVGYLGAGQSLTGAQVLTAGTTPGHAVDGEGIELEPQVAADVPAHGQFWDVNPTTSQATFSTFGYSTPAALLAPGDSTLVLDIPYASTAPNTQIMTYYENSGANQQWVFEAVGATLINVPISWTGNTPSTTTNPLQVPRLQDPQQHRHLPGRDRPAVTQGGPVRTGET